MANDSYASMVPRAPADDAVVPLGSKPRPDNDGDGDDAGVSRLGDIAPNLKTK